MWMGEQRCAVRGQSQDGVEILGVAGVKIPQQGATLVIELLDGGLLAQGGQRLFMKIDLVVQVGDGLARQDHLLTAEIIDGLGAHRQIGQVKEPGDEQDRCQGQEYGMVEGSLVHGQGAREKLRRAVDAINYSKFSAYP